MAKVNYENVYKQLRDEEEARKSALKKTDKMANVQSQIDNITTRMEASGVDVDKETDKRNVVEKFLGLPEDQNVLFDLFELLGRPQQALFGAWKENQDGGDLQDSLDAAWKHFKGDDETKFKEILKDNRLGWEFEDEKGKADLVDWLGFAGDVALDPADWAVIAAAPFTGGTSLLGLGANVKDVVKVADTAVDAAQAASKASKAAKAVNTAVDVAETAGKSAKVYKSLSDLVFEGIGKGVKGTAKLADSGLTKYLGYLDETKGVLNKTDNLLKNADEFVKIGYTNKAASNVADLGKYVRNSDELSDALKAIPKGRLETYVNLKQSISNAFKLPDKVKDALKISRNSDAVANAAKKQMQNIIKDYSDDVAASSKKIGMSVDEINEAMTDMIEYKGLNRVHKGSDIIKAAENGGLVATAKNRKIIEELAADVNNAGRTLNGAPFKLGYSVDSNNLIRLDGNWSSRVMSKVDDGAVSLNPELLNKNYRLSSNYKRKDLERFKKLEQNKAFMALFERNKDLSVKLNKVLDDSFGKDFLKKFGGNDGYVPHIYTGKAINTKIGDVLDSEIVLKGNRSILGDRTRLGSVLEENAINEKVLKRNYKNLSEAQKKFVDKNADIFERNYEAAMSKKFLDQLPTLLKNDKTTTEILMTQGFGDIEEMSKLGDKIRDASLAGDKDTMTKLAKEYNEKFGDSNVKFIGKNGVVPDGYTSIGKSGPEIAKKLEDLSKQLGGADISNITKQIRKYGDKIAVDNYVLNMINVLEQKPSDLARMFDKYMNVWYKRLKTLGPTYLPNNFSGNLSNMWLSGINITEQAKYFPDAARVNFEGASLLARKNAGEVLSAADRKIADLYDALAREGFGDAVVSAELRDMPESVQKYIKGDRAPKTLKEIITDGLPYLNSKANNVMDTISRTVVMMKGMDDPSYLAKLGVNNYGDAIRKVMFDPSELTTFEKNVMTKYIPFYTFAKKNLAYQLDNLGRNGGRYHKLVKTVQGLQDMATDGNSENIEEYIKNNLYIPIPGLAEDGSYTIIRTQLPFGNVIDLADDPLGGLVNMMGPAKGIFEFASNKNFFTGADIERYPGEKSKNIPFMTKKWEHALGTFTGLDVPLKAGSKVYKGIEESMNNGGGFFEGVGNGVKDMYFMEQNINTDELSRMYDDLDELEMLMQQYKGMGYEFATINELKKANPNATTNRIMAQLNKMSNIDTEPFEYFSDGSTFR